MANEITLTAKLQATLSTVTVANVVTGKTLNASGTAANVKHDTQEVLHSAETQIDLGDVDGTSGGDEYFLLLRNLDDDHECSVYVRITSSPTFQQVGLMRPGEFWGPVRMQKATATPNFLGEIWCKFATATGLIEVVACEAGTPA